MSIVLEQLTKQYGSQVAVDRVSLEVSDGELFVLLGTSGCGKSTILRLIAGLTPPTAGRILLHGRDVTALSPQQRGIGFVFQNYSIFRHMDVAENIEFGLKIRKVPPAKRAERREELLDLVGLAGLGNRRADQLSGGQQQRVALARALAYEPAVLLLDEPFGALDAKIRTQLRRSLKEIQKRLGVTTILVTHDQEEAFELADRLAVMSAGRLLEIGPPEQLYQHPQTEFVATFLGAGTILAGRAQAGAVQLGPLRLLIPPERPQEDGVRVQVLIRPEQVVLNGEAPPAGAPMVGQGTVVEQNFFGALRRVRLRLPRVPATRQIAPMVPFGEEGLLIDAVVPAEAPLPSHALWVGLRRWHILAPPPLRLLVYNTSDGPTTPLTVTRHLANRLRALVTILGVASDPAAAEALSEQMKRRQQEAGLQQAELRIRYGNPVEQIAIEKHEMLYEFLLLAAEDQSGTFSGRLGSTVSALLETADLPVLVTKTTQTRAERILICTAVGEPGKQDVQVGGRLARSLGATVTVLHVTRGARETGRLAQIHLERALATLRALEVAAEIKVRTASTATEGILAEAHTGAYGLIVVGHHGPHARSIFGRDDVTLQVLANANVPVLVVPANLI
ncbi:MAG: hypothetical protein DCC55_22220 [Chloroflexi bacterium]|nr:MAG: hypothetical protein DCC55_22220 [Chloroflexota bacterium]